MQGSAEREDRLPTQSASAALQNLVSGFPEHISTGLPHLDALLCGREVHSLDQDSGKGGFAKGQVTEIYGPPGVGKTAVA